MMSSSNLQFKNTTIQSFNGNKMMKKATLLKQQWLKLCTLMLVLMFSITTANAAVSGVTFEAVNDGTAPFDADDLPGHDSSPNNGIIRTREPLNYRITYNASSATSTKFVFTLPTGTFWDATASAASLCNGTGGGSISGLTLTCNRVTVAGTESFTVLAGINSMPNGANLQPTVVIDGAAPVLANALKISAMPKATTRTYFNNLAKSTLNGIAGYKSVLSFGIGVDASTDLPGSPTDAELIKGAESLAPGTTFQIATMPGAYLNGTCSGITSCTQLGGPGTPILVTISAQIDFTVSRIYTFFSPAINGTYFAQFPLFTPTDPNNTPADTSDDNFILGQESYLYTQVSGFDPNGLSGQSNYGALYSTEMDPSYVCAKNFGSAAFSAAYACGSLLVSRTATTPTMSPIFSEVSEQNTISNLLHGDDNIYANADSGYSEAVLPGQSFMAYSGVYSHKLLAKVRLVMQENASYLTMT